MSRPYGIVDASNLSKDPNLKMFADALTVEAKRDNEELNALTARKQTRLNRLRVSKAI